MIHDTDELRAFRQQWDREVRRKDAFSASEQINLNENSTYFSPKIIQALNLYQQATHFENVGKAQKALCHYQEAFRLEPMLGKYLLTWQEGQNMKNEKSSDALPNKNVSYGNFRNQSSMKGDSMLFLSTLRDIPTSLLPCFNGNEVSSSPDFVIRPNHISNLPSEILIRIFYHLACKDVAALETTSMVCHFWYVLSHDPSIWRGLCNVTWIPSIYKEFKDKMQKEKQNEKHFFDNRMGIDFVVHAFENNYRRMYIEKKHIRWDGIYIGQHHYIHTSENVTGFSNPISIVTYYRYLRFFQNGIVVSLLTNDKPATIMKHLKKFTLEMAAEVFENRQRTLLHASQTSASSIALSSTTSNILSAVSMLPCMKRLLYGRYEVANDLVFIQMDDPEYTHQHFKMVLRLSNGQQGNNNCLNWYRYTSISLNDGYITHYDLNKLRTYWFSRVRSLSTVYLETK